MPSSNYYLRENPIRRDLTVYKSVAIKAIKKPRRNNKQQKKIDESLQHTEEEPWFFIIKGKAPETVESSYKLSMLARVKRDYENEIDAINHQSYWNHKAEFGFIESLKFGLEKGFVFGRNIMSKACESGIANIECIRWLLSEGFPLPEDCPEEILRALDEGEEKMLSNAKDLYENDSIHFYSHAWWLFVAERGYTKVIKYGYERGVLLQDDILQAACKGGMKNIECIGYLVNEGFRLQEDCPKDVMRAIESARCNGPLSVINSICRLFGINEF